MTHLSRGQPPEPRPYRTLDIFTVSCAVEELARDVHAVKRVSARPGASPRRCLRALGGVLDATPRQQSGTPVCDARDARRAPALGSPRGMRSLSGASAEFMSDGLLVLA